MFQAKVVSFFLGWDLAEGWTHMNLHWTQMNSASNYSPKPNHPSLSTCVFSLLLCSRCYWPLCGRCGSVPVHIQLGDIHGHLCRRKHINLQTLTKPVEEMTAAAICILWLVQFRLRQDTSLCTAWSQTGLRSAKCTWTPPPLPNSTCHVTKWKKE